jgi:hypothetical protein
MAKDNTKLANKEEAKRRRKKKDPNAPKRPANAYARFTKAMRPEILKKEPGLGVGAIAKKISPMWNALTIAEKKPYVDEYEKDKIRYQKELEKYNQAGGRTSRSPTPSRRTSTARNSRSPAPSRKSATPRRSSVSPSKARPEKPKKRTKKE